MGKTNDKQNKKSLVSQVIQKQTKKEEYKRVCDELKVKNTNLDCEVLKDVKAYVDYFNSVPEEQSYRFVAGAVDEMDMERLNEIVDVLDPSSKKHNGAERKIEVAVGIILKGALTKVDAHLEQIQHMKQSLVLNMMRHCVNVSPKGAGLETKQLRNLCEARCRLLSSKSSADGADGDVQMEKASDLFGRMKI